MTETVTTTETEDVSMSAGTSNGMTTDSMTDTAAGAGMRTDPPVSADDPTIEVHAFDQHQPPPVGMESRPARHRSHSLLSDSQRAMFLQQWDAIQTGFVTSPDGTAEAAEQLVGEVARRIVQNIGSVRDQAMRPVDETALAQVSGDADEAATERHRVRLLQCREAFSLLIDS